MVDTSRVDDGWVGGSLTIFDIDRLERHRCQFIAVIRAYFLANLGDYRPTKAILAGLHSPKRVGLLCCTFAVGSGLRHWHNRERAGINVHNILAKVEKEGIIADNSPIHRCVRAHPKWPA